MGGLVMTTTATSAPVRSSAAPPRRRLLRFEGRLMAPGILLLAPLSLLPFVFIVVMSLSRVHLLGGVRFDFAGLVNWARVFTDPDVGMAWVRSFGYFVLTVGLEMGLGLVFALCLWRLLRGRTTVLSLMLLPMFVAPVFVGLLGRFLTDSTFGLYAWVLRQLGVQTDVLGSQGSAFAAVVLMDVWEWTPLITMIALAGLSAVPESVREAASLDGAGGWQMLRYVVLPSISNVLLGALLIRSMVAFRFFDLGYAATIGLLMLAVSIVIARAFVRLLDQKGLAR